MLQIWEYRDSADVVRLGAFLDFRDYGGTDVSYKFHRLGADGLPVIYENGGKLVDIVAGARLKLARRIGAAKIGEAFKLESAR